MNDEMVQSFLGNFIEILLWRYTFLKDILNHCVFPFYSTQHVANPCNNLQARVRACLIGNNDGFAISYNLQYSTYIDLVQAMFNVRGAKTLLDYFMHEFGFYLH